MCMYVFEICAEGIFVTFPWWLENVKSRSKIALFSNERHFEIRFPKKRTITFFWGKLSKLHKKDSILHVATIFSLKQGETRTSHGPIPHPLSDDYCIAKLIILPSLFKNTIMFVCQILANHFDLENIFKLFIQHHKYCKLNIGIPFLPISGEFELSYTKKKRMH